MSDITKLTHIHTCIHTGAAPAWHMARTYPYTYTYIHTYIQAQLLPGTWHVRVSVNGKLITSTKFNLLTDIITHHQGTLPIILTCHAGRRTLHGYAKRPELSFLAKTTREFDMLDIRDDEYDTYQTQTQTQYDPTDSETSRSTFTTPVYRDEDGRRDTETRANNSAQRDSPSSPRQSNRYGWDYSDSEGDAERRTRDAEALEWGGSEIDSRDREETRWCGPEDQVTSGEALVLTRILSSHLTALFGVNPTVVLNVRFLPCVCGCGCV
jgi:hypothetical protein